MLCVKISDFFCSVLRKRNPVFRGHDIAVLFEGRVICATPAARDWGLIPGEKLDCSSSAVLIGDVELIELDAIELQIMRHFWMASNGIFTVIKSICPDAKQDALDRFIIDTSSESMQSWSPGSHSSPTSSSKLPVNIEDKIVNTIAEMLSDLGYEYVIDRKYVAVDDPSTSVKDLIPAALDTIPDQHRLMTYKNSVLYFYDDESVEQAVASIVHNPAAPWHQHVAFRGRPETSENVLLLADVLDDSHVLLMSHLREIVTMWWESNAFVALSKLDSISSLSAAASLAKKKTTKSSTSRGSLGAAAKMVDMVVVVESEGRSLYTTTSEEVECPVMTYTFTANDKAAEVESIMQYALRLIQRSCKLLTADLTTAKLFLRENFLKSIVLSILLDWDVIYKSIPTGLSNISCVANTPSPGAADQPQISPGRSKRNSPSTNPLDYTGSNDSFDDHEAAPPVKKRRGRPPKNRRNFQVTANETRAILDSSAGSSLQRSSKEMVMKAQASSSRKARAASIQQEDAPSIPEAHSYISDALVESLFCTMTDEAQDDAFNFFDS